MICSNSCWIYSSPSSFFCQGLGLNITNQNIEIWLWFLTSSHELKLVKIQVRRSWVILTDSNTSVIEYVDVVDQQLMIHVIGLISYIGSLYLMNNVNLNPLLDMIWFIGNMIIFCWVTLFTFRMDVSFLWKVVVVTIRFLLYFMI